MVRIMKRISKQNKILALITIVFMGVYFLTNIGDGLLVRLINSTFIIGMFYIIWGMCVYIRNIGLFKSYKYLAYKIKSGAYSRKKMGQIRVLSLAEFTDELLSKYKNESGKLYYMWGIPLVVISYLLVLVMRFY